MVKKMYSTRAIASLLLLFVLLPFSAAQSGSATIPGVFASGNAGFNRFYQQGVEEPDPVSEVPDLVYDSRMEHRFAFFAEGALSIGGISHSFNDDAIEQFGYNVKTGCEQDGSYLMVGAGKHFGRFSSFLYGELGYMGPGFLFDNHGPYIAPEVLLKMKMLAGGIELRFVPVRVRLGYGSYFGSAEVDLDYDSTQTSPSGSWNTDIDDGHGWHFSVGYHRPVSENSSAGIEWVQHFINLRLAENGTAADPSEQSAVQREVRFVYTYQFALI